MMDIEWYDIWVNSNLCGILKMQYYNKSADDFDKFELMLGFLLPDVHNFKIRRKKSIFGYFEALWKCIRRFYCCFCLSPCISKIQHINSFERMPSAIWIMSKHRQKNKMEIPTKKQVSRSSKLKYDFFSICIPCDWVFFFIITLLPS